MSASLYVGGALPPEALYIERAADRELLSALSAGVHCHVLAPRQVGKTSLRIRTRRHLEADPETPRRCVAVDFTALGTEVAESDEAQTRWYLSLAAEMGRGLGLPLANIAEHWKTHDSLRGVDRWASVVRDLILTEVEQPIVVFFDEINALLRLRFRGEWLGALRALHNERASDPRLARLTFCLIGFARAEDLVPDMVNNPFDIAQTIALEDFTRGELSQAQGVASQAVGEAAAGTLLDAVFHWTHGHPLMTVALLRQALEDPPVGPVGPSPEALGPLVERLFPKSGLQAHPLLTAAATYLQSDWAQAPVSRSQALYARLLAGEIVESQAHDPAQSVLRISGVAALRDGRLEVRNRIYSRALDRAWIAELLNRRPLHEAAAAWDAAGRLAVALPPGTTLAALLDWAAGRPDLTELEATFLRAAHQQRQRRVILGVVAGAVVVLGLMAAGGFATIMAYQLKAERQEARATTLETVTLAGREADKTVKKLLTAELEVARSLDEATAEANAAETVLALVGPESRTTPEANPRLTALELQLARLSERAARLQRELDAARASRVRAEQRIQESTGAALSAVSRAYDAPVVEVRPTAPTPGTSLPTEAPRPVATRIGHPGGPGEEGSPHVELADAVSRSANLRSEKDVLDGSVSQIRTQLLDVMQTEVLRPRPKLRPASPVAPDSPVQAHLCVEAVSIAREKLEREKQALCAIGRCLEDRNPQDACFSDAPGHAELCR